MIGDKKSFFQILETLLINSLISTKKYGEIIININYLKEPELI